MPPLVALAAAYVADAIAVAFEYSMVAYTIAEAVVSAVIYAGLSYGLGAAFAALNKGPSAQQTVSDRLQLIRASRTTRRVVYGEVRTSGTMVFCNSTDYSVYNATTDKTVVTPNGLLHMVIALAGHECEAIETVYLNEVPLVDDPTIFDTSPHWDSTHVYVTSDIVVDATNAYSNPPRLYQRTNVLYTIPSGGPNSPPLNDTNCWIVIGDSKYFPVVNGGGWTPVTSSSGNAGSTWQNNFHRTNLIQVYKHLGSPTQTADTTLIANCPTYWTTNHRLQGICYLYIVLQFDPSVWTAGIPNISAVVKGKNDIYDPRTPTTGYSTNWALCNANYVTSPVTQGCLGGNYSTDIDETVLIANANICDEQIQYGGPDGGDLVPSSTPLYRNRYTCNGTIDTALRPMDVLTSLMSAGAGTIVWTTGKYQIFCAAYESPSYSLNENDLRDKITVYPRVSKKDLFNTIGGSYCDPLQYWQATNFPRQTGSAWVTEDGGELLSNIEMPFTTNVYEAQATALLMLRRARKGMTVDFPGKFTCLPISANSVITLSIAQLGFVNVEFRVLSWKLAANGQGVDLVLQEEDPLSYINYQGDYSSVTYSPSTILPSPWFVASPTNLTVSESLYYSDGIKGVKTKVILTWDNVPNCTYEVVHADVDGTVTTVGTPTSSPFTVWDVTNGPNAFQVRAINSVGQASDWALIYYTVLGKGTPPADVTGFNATIVAGFINLSWTPNADLDLAGYEVRVGSSWSAGAAIAFGFSGNGFSWQPPASATSEQFWIKAIDTSGNESLDAAGLTVAINYPTITNFSQQVIDNNVLLSWSMTPGGYPIDHVEIRKGLTYSSASIVGIIKGTFTVIFETASGTYKYWATPVDTAGLYGTPVGLYATVNQPPDFVFYANENLALNGTFTNCLVENGKLIAPVDISTSFQNHFINNSWSSPQDQINAGDAIYIQPTLSTGSYVETVDFGASIPNSNIVLSVTKNDIAAGVVITPTIATSPDNSTWTTYTGVYSTYASNFRYVKVTLSFAASGNALTSISVANLSLSVKLKTIQGSCSAVSTDSGGTVVNVAGSFLSVQSISVTPNSTTACYAIYNFTSIPNPTQFQVLLFNTSGTRISGPVSYTIRGV